jgi:hypothetical protein
MLEGLVGLLVLILIVGIVTYLVLLLVDMLPMEGGFKQVAKVLIILIAVLIVLFRALPLLGVSLNL